jgi:hypothetical protein
MLALGVDERVLEAGRMSQRLLEETAVACGGTIVQGFENIHRVFKEYSKPPAHQVNAVFNGGVPPRIVAFFGAALLVFAPAS